MQRTPIQFPSPMLICSQMPVIQADRNLTHFSGLHRHLPLHVWTHSQADNLKISLQLIKVIISIWWLLETLWGELQWKVLCNRIVGDPNITGKKKRKKEWKRLISQEQTLFHLRRKIQVTAGTRQFWEYQYEEIYKESQNVESRNVGEQRQKRQAMQTQVRTMSQFDSTTLMCSRLFQAPVSQIKNIN